jgi:hypothetical protein
VQVQRLHAQATRSTIVTSATANPSPSSKPTASPPPRLATLADLPDDALVGIDVATALYACSVRHFRRATDRGLVPPPVRIGTLVRWRIGTLREHIRSGCPRCR